MASDGLKVFKSYNRTDRDWAEWSAGVFERPGYDPILRWRNVGSDRAANAFERKTNRCR
jgi:hypothetical protein